MLKRPFLAFLGIVSLLVLGALLLIQTPQFAQAIKTIITQHFPKDLGIHTDFSNISLQFFPPGFSLQQPRIRVEEKKGSHLPPELKAGSSIEAERIDFSFRPFQMLSGHIKIHTVHVVNGKVLLKLESKKSKPGPPLKWADLLRLPVEHIVLKEVDFLIEHLGTPHSLQFTAKTFRLGQEMGPGGVGYDLSFSLKTIQAHGLQFQAVQSFDGNAFANPYGVKVDSLSLHAAHFHVALSGKIQGNLLEGASPLLTETELRLEGDLEEALRFGLIQKLPENLPKGQFVAAGKGEGDLKKLSETLRLKGTVGLEQFRFLEWKADSVKVEGQWTGHASGGELFLKKALITAQEKEREGGTQPGEGGKLEVGPLRWTVGSGAPLVFPVVFDRAHLHWLGAVALRKVYPLDARFTGSAHVSLKLPSEGSAWQLQSHLKLKVEQFALDNQRLQKIKPLTTIFKAPLIELDGDMEVNSRQITFNQTVLSLPRTRLKGGGKIDFKTGFGLHFSGAARLEDLGQIAENQVRGDGSLDIHVTGPFARALVNVDADLQDVYYLKLHLGNLKGRIVWDDDPNELLLQHIQATQGKMHYNGDGRLVFALNDSVQIKVLVPDGNMTDLFTIIQDPTASLTWLPRSLKGTFQGGVDVSGGLKFSQLKLLTQVHATHLEYLGEKFRSAKIEGGYDQGTYFIKNGEALKRAGKFLGRVSYNGEEKIDWELKSESLTVSDFDRIIRLDVPLRGNLQLTSSGKGKMGSVQSSTVIELKDARVRDIVVDSSHLSLTTKKGALLFDAALFGGEGRIDGTYDFDSKEQSRVRADFKRFDFSPFLFLLNHQLAQDSSLKALFSASLDLSFHAGSVDRSSGRVSLSEFEVGRTGTDFILGEPVSFKAAGGDFHLDHLVLKNAKNGEEELKLTLRNMRNKLDGELKGKLNLGILPFFTPVIEQTSGAANLNFSIGGSLKDPTLLGTITLDNHFVKLASIDSPVENITGSILVNQNKVTVQKLQANLGGGRVTAEGQVIVFLEKDPELNLKAQFTDSKLKIFPFQFVKFSGPITVKGESAPYWIEGDIAIDSAVSREKVITRKSSGTGLKVVQYSPPEFANGEGGSSAFKLRIKATAPRGIIFQNELFKDLEVKAALTLVNTLEAPRFLGTVDVLQGKLLFKDRAFQIRSGAAIFDSETAINPRFDLSADMEIKAIKISMYASGRFDKIEKMKVEFTSSPAMQESELLSLLATGFTAADAKKLSGADLSAVQQGEAASLVLHTLGFSRDIEDKTGFQLQLNESVLSQQGVSAFRPQSQADTSAAPQITIRRKLNERLSLSAGSTMGVGTSKSYQVNFDYYVNDHFSLTGVFNNYGTYGAADVQQINTNSMGLDFKFQKRFK